MAATKRPGRQRNQLPHCYFEGFLEKRSFKDKTSRKLWTTLCGNTLFFFNDNKACDQYVEKVELDDFIALTNDSSRDRNLDAARFNLRLKDGEIKLTAPSLEARELWKGHIYSAVKLSVPPSLNLLPGQINLLKETVEREKDRQKSLPRVTPAQDNSNPYVSVVGDMPACFHQVTRVQAQLLLESHPERGNMLLRPGGNGTSFAITTRQDLNGSVFKHYLVTREPNGGFAIDLEEPVPLATLRDAINYMVENTDGVMVPFTVEGNYDKNLTFVKSNEENGEKSVQGAASNQLYPPPLPPKPVKKVSASCHSEWKAGEKIYLNDTTDEEEEEEEEYEHANSYHTEPVRKNTSPYQTSLPCEITESSGIEKKIPLVPPPNVPNLFTPPSSASPPPKPPLKPKENVDRTRRITATVAPETISMAEELRLKLERRRMCQE